MAITAKGFIPVHDPKDIKAAGYETTLTVTRGVPTYSANCEHAKQYDVTLSSLCYFHIGNDEWLLCIKPNKVIGYKVEPLLP